MAPSRWTQDLFKGLFLLLAAVVVLLLAGCASANAQGSRSPVRRVITNEVSNVAELAETARRVANGDYEKIARILEVDPRSAPARFDIRFKEQLWSAYRGPTTGFAGRKEFVASFQRKEKTWTLLKVPVSRRGIALGVELLRQMPERLPRTVRHEMTHLYQDYADGAPDYWREGIADYVACELSAEAYPDCPQCNVTHPHYQEGYECAAALLRFIAEKYEPKIVPQLHLALVHGGYTDEFFASATGKPLEELWKEFQKTHRFTADAEIGLKLREHLKDSAGKNGGKMPPFFAEFLKTRRGGPLLIEACEFLRELRENGKWFGPAEPPSSVSLSQREVEMTPELPATRMVDLFYGKNKETVYRCEVRKESPSSGWTLVAVREVNNRTGALVRELPMK